jgi:hypothetical protein
MWMARTLGIAALGAALLLSPLAGGPVQAQDAAQGGEQTTAPREPAPGMEPQQVPLSAAQVENFLASWKDVEALREKFDAKYGAEAADEEGDPLFSLGNYLDKPDARGEIDQTLSRYSFGSFDEWANVAQSVMLAFGGADPESGPVDVEAEKRRITEEINADQALTPDEKQQALKDLDDQYAALVQFEPLPGNVEVVTPYVDRIRALFDDAPQ